MLFNVIGKGYILDWVCEFVLDEFLVFEYFSVNLGGDICKFGGWE